jgi:hypothetical protein
MATTSAFGWETPDDTDLVKDGAAAIRTLGNSIDTSMSELKGGTTGQILSKTSNTDMDFTWKNDTNPLTTKGDLYGYSTTNARVAVGTNGHILQADSSAATGLSYVGRRWYTLASGSLTGTEVSLTSLSTAYQTLRLEIYSPQTAAGSQPLNIRFNSNSSNVYEGVAMSSLYTDTVIYGSRSAISPMFTTEDTPTSAGTYSMYIEVDCYNDTVRKFIRGGWNQSDNAWFGAHNFNSTTAITSMQIRMDGSATFTGGTYVLRGI